MTQIKRSFRMFFTYKECSFVVVVDMNTSAERNINGRRWHTIEVAQIDVQKGEPRGYYQKDEVQDDLLFISLEERIAQAKQHIDALIENKLTATEQQLIDMGFEIIGVQPECYLPNKN